MRPSVIFGGLGVIGLSLGALGWAHLAELDVVVQGDGQVSPSRQAQVIQSLEGGIIQDLLVGEGDAVAAGQVLARIRDVGFAAELDELLVRRAALRVRAQRLEAEASEAKAFEPSIERDGFEPAAEEIALFEARRNELDQALLVIRTQSELRRAELEENRAKSEALLRQRVFLVEERTILERLAETQTVSALDVLRAQRAVSAVEGEISALDAAIARGEIAVSEALERLEERRLAYRRTARQELSETSLELAALEERIRASRDRLSRTEIRSPTRGVVNRVDITTLGAVLRPGQTLMEITPVEDELLFETRVRPADIGLLRPGLPAVVRITAYDYTKYGSLDGVVDRIGTDTIEDERGQVYYRAVVKTETDALEASGERLPIIPGMQGVADIIVGHRSVADYILGPLVRVRTEALREP